MSDPDSTAKETDLGDLFSQLSMYVGLKPTQQQFSKPTKTHFSAIPLLAYSLQTGFVAGATGSLTLHPDDPLQINTSSIVGTVAYTTHKQTICTMQMVCLCVGTVAYTTHKQTICMVQSSLWTKRNTYNFTGDLIYLQYPQTTYGLGTHSTFANENLINSTHLRVYETISRNIISDWFIGLGYNLDHRWNVKDFEPADRKTDFRQYGITPTSTSSGISVSTTFDSLRNAINPEPGWYWNMAFRTNKKALGSTTNWQSLIIDFRKYVKLRAQSKNILAFWSFNWLTLTGKPPYLDLPSTTFDNHSSTGRGFIQGRYRGRKMVYLESEYRFQISRNGLLGGVAFANAQSFSGWPNNNFERAKAGYGGGLRFKVNKHSKTNIAIDYGFGSGGSRGFFVNLCEMF